MVLKSIGIETRVHRGLDEWLLFTRSEMKGAAKQQLDRYKQENREFKQVRAPSPKIDSGIWGCVIYVSIIWGVWVLEYLGLLGNFPNSGAMWALAVRDNHEWWRAFTALMLHADLPHIVGNTAFGVLFGFLAGRYYGSGMAWFLIVCCGAGGNYLNALIQGDTFVSIGASTGMFAAVGLIGGMFTRRRFNRGRGWKYNAVPIAGVVGIFAFTGIGSEQTDVVAHFTGLLCGLVAGLIVANFDLKRLGRSGQIVAGIVTLALLGFCVLSTG